MTYNMYYWLTLSISVVNTRTILIHGELGLDLQIQLDNAYYAETSMFCVDKRAFWQYD